MLSLSIVSSATLTKGTKVQINALGLVDMDSHRVTTNEFKDGFVFFGCKKSIKYNQNSQDPETTTLKKVVNDFVIPTKST